MKTLLRLVVAVLMLTGWSLAVGAIHVVRGPSEFTIIPKHRFGIGDSYVDTRNWTLDDVTRHPAVVERLLELEKAEVLSHVSATHDPRRLEEELRDAVRRGRESELTGLAGEWSGRLPDIRF